jgi:hypothetical protein
MLASLVSGLKRNYTEANEPDRLSRLVRELLSPSVQMGLPAEAAEEPARLTANRWRRSSWTMYQA